MPPTEESWRKPARAARECIRILGYPMALLRCMPGEEEAGQCTGSVSEHALSYYAILKAIADHQITHMNPPLPAYNRIYRAAEADLNQNCRSTCPYP
jgi:hypothetical protein